MSAPKNIVVRDSGFHADDWPETATLDLGPEADPEGVAFGGVAAIRVAFPKFSDGRGFTLARRLRARGFTGRLRAHGHLIADQYTMLRRSGFDEAEIGGELAQRQPEDQWRFRAEWRAHDYRARMRG